MIREEEIRVHSEEMKKLIKMANTFAKAEADKREKEGKPVQPRYISDALFLIAQVAAINVNLDHLFRTLRGVPKDTSSKSPLHIVE
jgi:hypothetical protein